MISVFICVCESCYSFISMGSMKVSDSVLKVLKKVVLFIMICVFVC